MHRIELDVSMTTTGVPADAARIAEWISNAIGAAEDDAVVVVHAVRVEEADA